MEIKNTKILIDEKLAKLEELISESKKLFSLPQTYVMLSLFVVNIITKQIEKNKSKIKKELNEDISDEKIITTIKSDIIFKTLKTISFENNILNNQNDICNKLTNSDKTQEIINSIPTFTTPEDFVKNIESNSKLLNLDGNTSNFFNFLIKNKNKISNVLVIGAFSYVLYELISEISKSKFPSPNRVGYLKSLLKNMYNDFSEFYGDKNKLWNEIKPAIKIVYASITALLLISSIYKLNRSKSQKQSLDDFKSIVADSSCIVIEDAKDYQVQSNKFPSSIPDNVCNINEPGSSFPVPKRTFNEKINNVTCSIEQNEETPIINKAKESIINKAIIEGEFTSIKVSVGSKITENTILGFIGGESVYSPVIGTVSLIENNKIFIEDISQPEENLLVTKSLNLKTLFETYYEDKELIKNFYIESSYPILLANSKKRSSKKNIEQIYNKAMNKLNSKKGIRNSFNKNIQDITKSDRVKKESENNNLISIKNDIDTAEKTLFSELKLLYNNSLNKAKRTQAKSYEYSLIDYYVNLLSLLQDIKDPKTVFTNYIKIIHDILLNRLINDNYDTIKLKEKINDYVKEIEGIDDRKDNIYFQQIDNIWNNTKSYDSIKNFLTDKINKNKKIELSKVQLLVNRVLYLYKFYREVSELTKKSQPTNVSIKSLTTSEAILIKGYFDTVWKSLDTIQTDIDKLIKEIELTIIPIQTSTITINNEDYIYYKIKQDNVCEPTDNEDPYLSSKSKKGLNDIDYWLKYCSMATLIGVINPSSWSTGILAPMPILLPVIYIPIKGLQVDWGVMCIGLTICGYFVMPFILSGNLTNRYTLPIGDITKPIKNEIKEIKKILNTDLRELKNNILQNYINNKKSEIDLISSQLKDAEFNYSLDKAINPTTQLEKLNKMKKIAEDKEIITTLRSSLYVKQKTYNSLIAIQNGSSAEKENKELKDPKISFIDERQKNIDKQFTKLEQLVNKMQKILIVFPSALAPNSANFTPTLKNPKPKIEIADKLDETFNLDVLDKINSEFKMSNEDYLSPNFSSKSAQYKKYLSKISSSINFIIKNDPFPKYENIKLSNLSYIKFLSNNFVMKGSYTFGIPGQLPIPIN